MRVWRRKHEGLPVFVDLAGLLALCLCLKCPEKLVELCLRSVPFQIRTVCFEVPSSLLAPGYRTNCSHRSVADSVMIDLLRQRHMSALTVKGGHAFGEVILY